MSATENPNPLPAIKGFKPDLTCRGFQYVEGETFEQDTPARLCDTGFHAVTMPLDVFRYYPPAPASGDSGAATASGYSGAATASGYSGAATASGRYGAATASGRYGAATASGYYGAATASGYYGAATASGRYGAATASGDKSVAVASGYGGKAAGSPGSVLFLIERDTDWNIIGHASVQVDGEQIKADTFYSLRGGKVVES